MMAALGEGTLGKYCCLDKKLMGLSARTNGAEEKAHCWVTHLEATTNQHYGTHQRHQAGLLFF